MWMGKTAFTASACLALCPHSASPGAIHVPRSLAVTVSAMMHLEGEASPQRLVPVHPCPSPGPDCLPLQLPLCV